MKTATLITIAGMNGFIATGLAAMGSHTLPIAADDMDLFKTAYLFHFIHTFALLACAALVHWGAERWGNRAAIFFIVGILCFSVSLYFRAVSGAGSLGNYHWITPIGGLALMAGWLSLAWGGFSSRYRR